MKKPDLLYVSPVTPLPSGNGLAMRAFHNLYSLSGRYSVYLLIFRTGIRNSPIPREVSELCALVEYIPVDTLSKVKFGLIHFFNIIRKLFDKKHFSLPYQMYFLSKSRIRKTEKKFLNIKFDIIHIFRLYTYPAASLIAKRNPESVIQLDLDDIESLTHRRMADLYKMNGNGRQYRNELFYSGIFQDMEDQIISQVDRVFVCSDNDKKILSDKYRGVKISVVPNAVFLPEEIKYKSKVEDPFVFLIIGSWSYYPNEDAIDYLCQKILPFMREKIQKKFIIKIIGKGLEGKLLKTIKGIKEIQYLNYVDDLVPLYNESDAVLIPIRAGGGTRIKALEAFAYKKPVISTTIGVEGLKVNHDVHILIGDDPKTFAEQCTRVVIDNSLGKSLAKNAYEVVSNQYNIRNLVI